MHSLHALVGALRLPLREAGRNARFRAGALSRTTSTGMDRLYDGVLSNPLTHTDAHSLQLLQIFTGFGQGKGVGEMTVAERNLQPIFRTYRSQSSIDLCGQEFK